MERKVKKLKETTEEFYARDDPDSIEAYNEVIEELVENSIIAANKFTELLKAKTMPRW